MDNFGVFTTIKVVDSTPLFFDKHEFRLFTHAKALNIPIPKSIEDHVFTYIEKHTLSDCALKVTISPTGELIIQSRPLPPANPVSLITLPDTRNKYKTLKTTDRKVNDQARNKAQVVGADDALFVLDDEIIEAAYANVISLENDGTIITPPLEGKGLKGIARQILIERLAIKEKALPKTVDQPMVLVNSLRIQPVTTLDGRVLPDATSLANKLKEALEV